METTESLLGSSIAIAPKESSYLVSSQVFLIAKRWARIPPITARAETQRGSLGFVGPRELCPCGVVNMRYEKESNAEN
jgi:hypothetical protein